MVKGFLSGMGQYITQHKGQHIGAHAQEIKLENHTIGPLARKILEKIAKEPMYPAAVAKQLNIHEQKIYYHIKRLEKAGIIVVKKEEMINGSTAKYYALAAPVLCTVIGELQETSKTQYLSPDEERFLSPFIKDGVLNALIVTGSPDPHGPEKARSRDGYYGIDLAFFLGKYLQYTPRMSTKLDTEFREEDWKNNLILFGGPITNRVVNKINDKLHIYFDENNALCSKLTKQIYVADEIGVIQKIRNPFAEGKWILMIAGKRYTGTRAAITAFYTAFDELLKGNRAKPQIYATVVEGIDLDSDGLIDAVEIRE